MRKEIITSAQNAKIKELLALQEKARLRREKSLFVAEGRRELGHCLAAGYIPDTIFYCPDIIGREDTSIFIRPEETLVRIAGAGIRDARYLIEVPAHIYDKVAYRGGTEGIIAELQCKEHGLDSLSMRDNPLIVVLESVEKPGNLGAVLRSADAAGADAVIVCDPLTDLYNPNLIRSSIGGIFTVQCCTATSEEAITWLKEHGIQILTAQLQDSEWYYDTDMKKGTAIVIGTEATGLTDVWRKAADAHIKIPMLGRLDSLNASVSAAILMFEAVRQRNSNI
ncbi:MAG: RNA methyltransferase [Bacteroidales bacterium]|nr:RNA methyltransferase [Bacteroidales bacterium]